VRSFLTAVTMNWHKMRGAILNYYCSGDRIIEPPMADWICLKSILSFSQPPQVTAWRMPCIDHDNYSFMVLVALIIHNTCCFPPEDIWTMQLIELHKLGGEIVIMAAETVELQKGLDSGLSITEATARTVSYTPEIADPSHRRTCLLNYTCRHSPVKRKLFM
jgi:hypothetical protein